MRQNSLEWIIENRWLIIFIVSIPSLILLALYLFSPLIDGIVMGIVFAYVGRPVKDKLCSRLKFGDKVSALLVTLLIILPIGLLVTFGLIEGINQLIWLVTHQADIEAAIMRILKDLNVPEEFLNRLSQFVPNLFYYVQGYVSRFTTVETTIKLLVFFLNFLISGFVCYYLLADGSKFFNKVLYIIPEKNRGKVKQFFVNADEILGGLWFGNFLVALLIAFASIPFFLAFNVPLVALLAGLMFLAALIPIFAEWMIIVPVTIYLIYSGSFELGIVFLVSGAVGLYIIPELFLRPYLVGYTSRIHPLLLMLAFIGGGLVGGIAGFFLAPMIVGILTALYRLYVG
jgi:predicted PurR-regulated permease PerM